MVDVGVGDGAVVDRSGCRRLLFLRATSDPTRGSTQSGREDDFELLGFVGTEFHVDTSTERLRGFKYRSECELFIVEGNSAAGSAKEGRNPKIQAILPLRGKVLNTERARLDKMLANQELVSLIKGLGVGIGEQFDISGLRYDKIIFMTDADVDGLHIATLLMTFFFRYMPQVIEEGHVYLAKPPLFGLIKGTGSTRKIDYMYDENALEAKLAEKIKEKKDAGTKVDEGQERFKQAGYTAQQRFKGLGEMDAKQLWETTMDPENRILVQVHIDDAEKADAVFTKLMGDQVDLRKNFIQAGAASVDLDDLDF